MKNQPNKTQDAKTVGAIALAFILVLCMGAFAAGWTAKTIIGATYEAERSFAYSRCLQTRGQWVENLDGYSCKPATPAE